MSYQSIGKTAWEALPNIFGDTSLSQTLQSDKSFVCATDESPHSGKSRIASRKISISKTGEIKYGELYIRESIESAYVDDNGKSIATVKTEYGVSYSKLTGMFTKYSRHVGTTVLK